MPADSAPLERDEIFEIVRDRLADILEIEPATITEGQSFVDDLDADSLALIELVEALEEQLGAAVFEAGEMALFLWQARSPGGLPSSGR